MPPVSCASHKGYLYKTLPGQVDADGTQIGSHLDPAGVSSDPDPLHAVDSDGNICVQKLDNDLKSVWACLGQENIPLLLHSCNKKNICTVQNPPPRTWRQKPILRSSWQ